MLRALAVGLLLAGVALPARLLGQASDPASVRIRVTDAITGEAIDGARVGFPELRLFSLTDTAGTAVVLSIPPGDHAFEVTMLGYGAATGTLHLAPGAVGEDEVALLVQPFEIEGFSVDGRRRWATTLQRSGFYDRARIGFGRQLDRDALRRRFGWRLDEALRGILPNCTGGSGGLGDRGVSTFGNSAGPIATQTMGMGANQRGGPVVFFEGIPWMGELSDIPVDWVEGVEIYRSMAGVPAQYSGWAPCGVILIWPA